MCDYNPMSAINIADRALYAQSADVPGEATQPIFPVHFPNAESCDAP